MLSADKLKAVLELHRKWLEGETDGEKANLRGTDLRGADLSGAGLKIFQAGLWTAYIQKDSIRIGCHNHSIGEWDAFSDERISEMHDSVLAWWKENKAIVLGICRSIAHKEPQSC